MPHIVVYESGGVGHVLDAPVGYSVMEIATRNGVAGIYADCGGSAACATCHVLVDPLWIDRLPAMRAPERDLLHSSADATPRSRLACQIAIDERLDGLIVRVPGF